MYFQLRINENRSKAYQLTIERTLTSLNKSENLAIVYFIIHENKLSHQNVKLKYGFKSK